MSRLSILSHLNHNQQEAVTFKNGPLLVLAGPGSGKTRTLTHRVAWLIEEKKVKPENILLLTFTNKAAEEMTRRIEKLAGLKPPLAGTFHSFCSRILRIEGRAINIPINFLIYDEQDQLETIKLVLKELDLSPTYYRPALVLRTISQIKNELISPLEYPQYAQGDFQTNVARAYLTYQRFLKEYQALDFDDLLMELVHLLQTKKEVLNRYQNRFLYLLVDEYQDTNHAQYVLTKLLVGKWRNFCVVGDASQAIYGFRGANFQHLMNLKKDFPDLKIINLAQNYRSTPVILKAACEVIKKNTSHPILELWTEKQGGEPVFLYEAQDEIDEANFVVNTILPSLDLSRFAVLYRTNSQSRVLEEAFLRAGLPYLLVGGTSFYERKEIKDCLAYLRLINNPKDKISLKRIEKIGKRRKEKFLKLKMEATITLEILDEVLEQVGYLDLFDEKDEQDRSRLENIKELRSVASQFPKLIDFLENVSLISQEYKSKKSESASPRGELKKAVSLMTIHAAKGTEFPVVFMIGMEEGLFPHSRSMIDKDGIEEERRLCYVGMTRAKEKLYLIYTRNRLYFGHRTANPISRFICDIPESVINRL